ncbi:MAG: hypothetical protein M3Q03_12985 [Chloroflexota bacterium]|nr:hypothetical protein [Chloroflexota bacterium]
MKLRLAVLADAVNTSQDGKLNLLGVFNTIYFHAMPEAIPALHLVLRLEADRDEWGVTKELTVRLIDADGKTVVDVTGDISVPASSLDPFLYVDQILSLEEIEFWRDGEYRFDILVDGQLLEPGVSFQVVWLGAEDPRNVLR